jgi:hypothetical protein
MTAGGGYLVISTPSDQGGSDVHSDGDTSFIGEHVRDGYGREEITEKLKTAGYGEVTAYYTYGTPGSRAWRLSMKYPVMMLSASKLFFILLPFYYLAVMPFVLALNCADLNGATKREPGCSSLPATQMKLSLYIAKRYLFAKKSRNAINVISAISVAGVQSEQWR